jgi:hypothetical protein
MSASALFALILGVAFAGRRDPMPPPDAPVIQEDRVEISVDPRDIWTVEPVGEAGLVLLGTDNRGASWTLVRYDTEFHQQWVQSWDAPSRKVQLVDRTVSNGVLTLLLHQVKRDKFTLLEVQLADGTIKERTLDSPARLRAAERVAVVGDDTYVLAAVRDQDLFMGTEGELLHIDTADAVSVVPVAKHLDARRVGFLRLTTDEDADALDLSLATQKRKRRSVHTFSVTDGQVKDRRTLSPPADGSHNLLTAQRVRTSAADLLIGTYASGAKGVGAQGLFVSKLDEAGTETWRRTISFTDLDRFFDYLPKRKQARVERRAERKKDKGTDLRLGYLLNLHDVVEADGRLLVIGEAFYPEYETRQRVVTYVENGVTKTRIEYYTVFVGYRYTHAVVVALNEQGEKLWDASFEIGNILSYAIRDRVKVDVDGDRITMVYAYGGAIFSKVATPDGVLDDKLAQRAQAVGGGRVKRTWATHTEHWYDDHFIVWSYDKVVGGEGGRRKVFAFATVSDRDPGKENHQ